MRLLDLIEAKKRDDRLTPEQIEAAVRAYVAGEVPDYQMAALLMAIRWRGLDRDEAVALTRAMVASGEVWDHSDLRRPTVDKHSTGGVGDKVSLVLAPLVAACGCAVPMVSGRGLGHTGGTLDKLESIPGLRTGLDRKEFAAQLERIGVAMGAQTEDFVPADRLLYALRDVTGTIDDPGLMTASILSKKIAEGTRALVLDVKFGAGAFLPEPEAARRLAHRLRDVATGAGLRCAALLSDMDQPLGATVGNALEVAEAVAVLRAEGPADVRAIVLALAAEMLVLGGVEADLEAARAQAERRLDDGRAAERFELLLEAQGGDPGVVGNPERLPASARRTDVASPGAGFVAGLDARRVGRAALALGAGRETLASVIDPAAGLWLHAKRGDAVERGEPWVTMFHGPDADLGRARRLLDEALRVEDNPPAPTPLILERLA